LYGPFCHGALKHDISTLFTTFFVSTLLQFILLLYVRHFDLHVVLYFRLLDLHIILYVRLLDLLLHVRLLRLTRYIVCTTPRRTWSLYVRYLDLHVLLHVRLLDLLLHVRLLDLHVNMYARFLDLHISLHVRLLDLLLHLHLYIYARLLYLHVVCMYDSSTYLTIVLLHEWPLGALLRFPEFKHVPLLD